MRMRTWRVSWMTRSDATCVPCCLLTMFHPRLSPRGGLLFRSND